ncbi:hypothetical protein PIB30_103474 [Stylosanthes scabra]|uniref:Uncharacterized protein n=1 Tax=Stylosanthes scabra TaxID=79078 RepID=A0ABU6WW96_9FABA|nr:hypothetical protein [Stylosanthes scabra]
MARQMGFSQAIPAPYSTDPAQQICHLVPHSFREIKTFLSDNLLTRTFYDPIPCRSSNFVTKNFIKWWDAYYIQYNRSLDEMIAGINREKEQLKESEKVVQEEQAPQKRKAESVATKKTGSSKQTSKRARVNPKKPSRNIELPKVPSKVTSTSEKPPKPESARSASDNSLDVSSKSKESSNSKDKRASPEKERIEEPTARESTPSLNVIVGKENLRVGLAPKIIQEVSTPKVPIQAGSNQGTHADPRIQFKEKLEETRAASVEKVKQSMKPLPPIPVIDLDGGDPDLADLLQMISESKVGSEPDISNSVNKTIPQEKEKEDTTIQRARSESLQKILLMSAAEKMIRLMDQPLDMLQKDPYWNDELVKVTSCLVERQFPEKYREQVLCFGKIFENLFITREKQSNVRLKVAMIQENSNGLIIAKKALKEKETLYEKHLSNANDTLEGL